MYSKTPYSCIFPPLLYPMVSNAISPGCGVRASDPVFIFWFEEMCICCGIFFLVLSVIKKLEFSQSEKFDTI